MAEELASALVKYAHLIGTPINVDWIKKVERAQQEIIKQVRERARESDTLSSFLSKLDSSGELPELVKKVAQEIEEEVPDVRRAIAAALSGNSEEEGFRSALLALQAVARAFAEGKEAVAEQSAFCPLCGARSETIYRRGNKYYMVCHFCTYTWIQSTERPSCPYCGNYSEFSIGMFSDKQKRVALMKCWECGSSWRVILDESIRAPAVAIPLIGMAAEKFRRAAEDQSSG
ncbi:MAG: formate dehydrogenase accessory protein FdhE [Acidilobaceae archaeon]|nr:formate dehydrogenase accessory protein FdhE [Acidilobaceae archaeon]MCX8165799.1 formate dehydrogenase accessory protein FdhE [Acidilobaceae archaeon]MDW7974224.1 formate dehydrogenase accessory protein FdhE [Sulfolobales archaeon]